MRIYVLCIYTYTRGSKSHDQKSMLKESGNISLTQEWEDSDITEILVLFVGQR